MEVHSCEECSYKTKLLFGMIYHVRRHRLNSEANLFSCEKPPKPYSCPHCYFESDLSIVLKEHAIAVHKNEEAEEVEDYNYSTYGCETCKFQTFSVLVMLKHVTNGCVETIKPSTCQRKRFECDQCPYSSKLKGNLNVHKIYKHTNPENIKWLECDRCESKFKTASCLRKHIKSKHEIEWFECAQCPYKSVSKFNFRKHTYRKHSDPIKWFECAQCPYKTIVKTNLQKHTYVKHSDLSERKWLECDHCSYTTKNKFYLASHKKRNHTNPEDIKWLECDRCELKFKTKNFLRLHIKRKHEIEWFQCAQCPYKTIDQPHLRRHIYNKHSDPSEIKWLECDRCSYKCKDKSNLKQHMNRKNHLGHKEKKSRLFCGQ